MAALGDRPVREVTTREVEDLLRSIASTGVAARTVNKTRQLVCAIFNYGMRPSTYGLAPNPATHADRRREPEPGPLAFYSPEQVEQLARSLAAGAHRDPSSRPRVSEDEMQPPVHVRMRKTPNWYASRHTPGCAEASSLRSAGATSTSRVASSSSAARCPVRPRSARLRAAERARSLCLTRPQRRSTVFGQRGDFIGADDYVFANRFRPTPGSVGAASPLRARP